MAGLKSWRLVIEDEVTPTYGLAADEICAQRVGADASPPTLRLYTYVPCALVGRFQTLENELRVEACRERGITVNRRPTGGGAIVMGPDQLGVAWTVRGADQDGYRQARAMMAHFSEGIVAGLARLGLEARFRGKNDLEVGGRKVAGLGVYRDKSGGVLYHASVLVGLDVAWMLSLLQTPFEKISDKVIATVAQRVTTVRREIGRDVSLDEMREHLMAGFRETFSVELEAGAYDSEELGEIRVLEREKYETDEWVRQRVEIPDAFGTHKVKTPAGLLEIRATLVGPTIKAVYIGGDFFAAEGALADLEGALRWHGSTAESVRETVNSVYGRWGEGLSELPEATVSSAVLAAVHAASGGRYGCFVNPQGGSSAR